MHLAKVNSTSPAMSFRGPNVIGTLFLPLSESLFCWMSMRTSLPIPRVTSSGTNMSRQRCPSLPESMSSEVGSPAGATPHTAAMASESLTAITHISLSVRLTAATVPAWAVVACRAAVAAATPPAADGLPPP